MTKPITRHARLADPTQGLSEKDRALARALGTFENVLPAVPLEKRAEVKARIAELHAAGAGIECLRANTEKAT